MLAHKTQEITHKNEKKNSFEFHTKRRHEPNLAEDVIGLVLKKKLVERDATSLSLVLGIGHAIGRKHAPTRHPFNKVKGLQANTLQKLKILSINHSLHLYGWNGYGLAPNPRYLDNL